MLENVVSEPGNLVSRKVVEDVSMPRRVIHRHRCKLF